MFFGKKREVELENKLGEIKTKIQSTKSELNSQLDYENENAQAIKEGINSVKEKNENVKRDLSLANAKLVSLIDEMKEKAEVAEANAELVDKVKATVEDNDAFDTTKITKNADKIQNEVRNNDRNVGTILEEMRSIEVISTTLKEVSNQTSALSLNAAIMGARIDSGNEGFVQTATEIKELAAEGAKAVNELNRKVERIISLIDTIMSGNTEMKDLASQGVLATGEFEKTVKDLAKIVEPDAWSKPEKALDLQTSIKDIENLKKDINDIWTAQDVCVSELEELEKKAEAQIEIGEQAKEIAEELNV